MGGAAQVCLEKSDCTLSLFRLRFLPVVASRCTLCLASTLAVLSMVVAWLTTKDHGSLSSLGVFVVTFAIPIPALWLAYLGAECPRLPSGHHG